MASYPSPFDERAGHTRPTIPAPRPTWVLRSRPGYATGVPRPHNDLHSATSTAPSTFGADCWSWRHTDHILSPSIPPWSSLSAISILTPIARRVFWLAFLDPRL